MKIDIRSVTIVLASMFTAGCCAKAISKKVYELLAEKIATAYDSLYSTIK